MSQNDIEKMRAYANAGGVLSHDDALNLLSEVHRLREALQDIQTNSARHRVLEITRDVLGTGQAMTILTEMDIAALCGAEKRRKP